MGSTRQALINDTSVVAMLYMALELSSSKWLVAISDGERAASQHTLRGGDVGALLQLIEKAKKRCNLQGAVRVHSCYEAGRDGFWLHRWLLEQGIDNVVVDSSSIEVNRRARRAKSDALDVAKLYEMLVRYAGGEKRVWRVVRVPSVQQEDERRLHRELGRLKSERNAHVNRIRSLAVLHNVRLQQVGGRGWAERLEQLKGQVPAGLWAEIERESVREKLVWEQMRALEQSRKAQLKTLSEGPLLALLKLRAIGLTSAWDSIPVPTTAASRSASKASAKRATGAYAPCWWRSPGTGCAISHTAHSVNGSTGALRQGASACGASASWPWRADC
jgi:transposase